MSGEIWRLCFGSSYAASSLGRVRRAIPAQGTRAGYILSLIARKDRYVGIRLQGKDRRRSFLVHRLVARAFLGPCPLGKEVNHKNGIKSDNRIENLEYVTRAQNIRHSFDTGLREFVCRIQPEKALKIGEQNGRAKLTEGDVRTIREAHKDGAVPKVLASRFGVCVSTIWNIVSRKQWRHVG